MDKNSIGGTFAIAGGLCLAASLVVSVASVSLRPQQQINKELDRKKNILVAADLFKDEQSIDEVFAKYIQTKVVDLATGEYVESVNAKDFDPRKAAKDPEKNHKISDDHDIAGIKVRSQWALTYEVYNDQGGFEKVVLPVHGKGLWSTLYGFLAVNSDLNTVGGLGFYEHAETPGLGGEVDNPRWKALWPGKKIYNDQGEVALEVIKGNVDPSRSGSEYKVDGLSGATITSRGVSHLLQYWLSDHGYKTYIKKLNSVDEE